MRNWYVATCKIGSGYIEQERAEGNLLAQGYETYNPSVLTESMKKGTVVSRIEPVFPGYIFVRFDPETQPASKINNSRGVKKLISFSDYPLVIDDDIVSGLKERFESNNYLITNLPQKDQVVELTVGPMAGLKAIFKEPDGLKRSVLLINMLGKAQKIVVHNTQFV